MKGRWFRTNPSLQANTTNLECKVTPGFHGGVSVPWCLHLFSYRHVVCRVTHNRHASVVLGSCPQQGNPSCKRTEAWRASLLDTAQQESCGWSREGTRIDHLCQTNVPPSLQQGEGTARVLFRTRTARESGSIHWWTCTFGSFADTAELRRQGNRSWAVMSNWGKNIFKQHSHILKRIAVSMYRLKTILCNTGLGRGL